ncbi:MAG: DNA primase, partial [Verrucomicrobiae bacterium]|nr:DNA primase [Verrucomicrobiae bacterium]
KEGSWQGVASMLGEFPDPTLQQLVSEAVSETRPIENRGEQIKQIALRLRDQSVTAELATLTTQLADPSLSDEQRKAILRRQQQLRAMRKQPLAPLDDAPA